MVKPDIIKAAFNNCKCKGHPLNCYDHPINCGCNEQNVAIKDCPVEIANDIWNAAIEQAAKDKATKFHNIAVAEEWLFEQKNTINDQIFNRCKIVEEF